MPMPDVKRWMLETALKAAEQWLMVCGVVARAGRPLAAALALNTGLVAIDVKREAINEKSSRAMGARTSSGWCGCRFLS